MAIYTGKKIPTTQRAMEAISSLMLDEPSLFLVSSGLLSHKQVAHYASLAKEKSTELLHFLATHKILPEHQVADALVDHFHLQKVTLDALSINDLPNTRLSVEFMLLHRVLPVYVDGNRLFVATDNPFTCPLKSIQLQSNYSVSLMIAETAPLCRFLYQLQQAHENKNLSNNQNPPDNPKINEPLITTEENAPIIQFINRIFHDAIHDGVSDIHFEPYEQSYRIRYRQDGLLRSIATPPAHLAPQIASRIKIIANLDIAEKRLPQDGHFTLQKTPFHRVDCRVSTCPTISGESIVVRLMDSKARPPALDSLGLTPLQETIVLKALAKPQGLILVTGPTGSGKTNTLYSALHHLNSCEKNIMTVEDPVEITMAGINQVNINSKAGLVFSSLLRSLLRQDPDVMMIGEIRDKETATIAIHAAQTGHLVLSTLHTNSAIAAITRLRNMGIAPHNIASTVHLIIAQRLVRRLCAQCKVFDTFSKESYRAKGCHHCYQGYNKRAALFEVFPLSSTIQQLIYEKANASTLLQQAQQEGMMTLQQSGLELIQSGITSIDEVTRVIS